MSDAKRKPKAPRARRRPKPAVHLNICDECKREYPSNFGMIHGTFYDCWDVDGYPSYSYDVCSEACENKLREGLVFCERCDRELLELQEHPDHPPRGATIVEYSYESMCRRCADARKEVDKGRAKHLSALWGLYDYAWTYEAKWGRDPELAPDGPEVFTFVKNTCREHINQFIEQLLRTTEDKRTIKTTLCELLSPGDRLYIIGHGDVIVGEVDDTLIIPAGATPGKLGSGMLDLLTREVAWITVGNVSIRPDLLREIFGGPRE